MRSALAAQGLTTITFDYAYTAAGRKAPDRLPKLLDVHEAVGVQIAERFGELVLAGKSMGGRVGGHLVAERGFGALGVVYYGYPLLPIGASDPRSTDHLAHIDNPQLFVSGDRDRMGPIEAIRAVADSVPDGRVLVIEGGDHSLKPLKSTGRDLEASIRLAAGATAAMAAGSAGTGR